MRKKRKVVSMYQTVAYENLRGNFIMIDVRSPGEYAQATIPGAVSLPLFDDAQRSRIGHVYVNDSIEKAKIIGMEAVAAKLPILYDRILGLNKQYDKLVFFCAKGGMRSASLVALMVELGISAIKLKGGYKGYREFINRELPRVNEKKNYIVIHGKTGIGKTQILSNLKSKGYDVLDLEEAASHRGSLLGNVGLGLEKSQKQFESIVYESLSQMKGEHVFVEGESRRIGNIIIPHYIFESMNAGKHVLADADLDFRARILIRDYTQKPNCQEEIIKAIESMERYIGEKNAGRYCGMVRAGEYEQAAKELMVKYYDPMYSNEFKKYKFDLTIQIENIEESTRSIENWFNRLEEVVYEEK